MLKYLFVAQFNDGTFIYQTPEDKSELETGRSQFYDVLQKEKDIVAFSLFGDGHQYTVNIETGHFEIDGIPFFLYNDPIENRRLIFFRRHTHLANVDFEELSHTIEYHMGFQGNVPETGENVQRVIIIS